MKTYKREGIAREVDVRAVKDAIESNENINPACLDVMHDMETKVLSVTFNLALRDGEERAFRDIVDAI